MLFILKTKDVSLKLNIFRHVHSVSLILCMKFTIITPAYNMSSTLGRAIESVLAQTYPDREMIVIENIRPGEKRLENTYEDKPGIRILSGTFGDRSEARNFGIAHSDGDYITFLDADDALDPGYLEHFSEIFRQDPDCIAISDILKIEEGKGRHWQKAGLYQGNPLKYAVNEGNITFAARRGYFLEQPFEYDYWEDKLWLGRMGEKHPFKFTGKPDYRYYITSKIFSESDFHHSMNIETEAINALYAGLSAPYALKYPKTSALNDFYIKKAYVALSLGLKDIANELITQRIKKGLSIKTFLRWSKLKWEYLTQ